MKNAMSALVAAGLKAWPAALWVVGIGFELGTWAARGQSLGDALNAPGYTWTTGPSFSWSVQTSTTLDGLAAQSASATVSGSILQTTITGPGAVTFWWHSPSFWNYLSAVVGTNTISTAQATISGTTNWQLQTIYLGTGAQVVKWIYWYGVSTDAQRGYLDQVGFAPGTTAPFITRQPVSQSQFPGQNATFAVLADGTPPLSYQWQCNGTNIAGATGASLTVTNVHAPDLGAYQVVITNMAGSAVSSNATLEFGRVVAWGRSSFDGTAVAPGTSNAVSISAGTYHALALKSDLTVVGWGTSPQGQLPVPAGLSNVIAVAAGGAHSLALKADGTVTAWGSNYSGQTNVPPDLTNVVAIAAGADSSLALKADGTVVSWGDNSSSQTNVPPGLSNVVAITVAERFNLALKADGTVSGWGYNSYLQTNIPAFVTNVIGIGGGVNFYLALKADRTVLAWGNPQTVLTNVPSTATNVTAVDGSGSGALALRADGSCVAWGYSSHGLTNIPSGLSNVVDIVAGDLRHLALVGDAPPLLTAPAVHPHRSGEAFTLAVPSRNGRVYALEYTEDLSSGLWRQLPLVAGTGRGLVLTDSSATNRQRFYRVRRW